MLNQDNAFEQIQENQKDYPAILEGILFTMGKSVEISALAAALELTEEEVKKYLHELEEIYKRPQRGLSLLFLDDKVQLCTKPDYFEYLVRIAAQPKKHVLTESVLETLSIVAYKQPVTRAEIERIRGVKSEHAINRLIEYGLIEEAGRMDAPGRPILFATTEEFLRSFGVSSLLELPAAAPGTMENLKQEAEKEIPLTIDP